MISSKKKGRVTGEIRYFSADEEDEFIIWMLSDGEFYKEHIATEDIAGLLNRYGALVYTVE